MNNQETTSFLDIDEWMHETLEREKLSSQIHATLTTYGANWSQINDARRSILDSVRLLLNAEIAQAAESVPKFSDDVLLNKLEQAQSALIEFYQRHENAGCIEMADESFFEKDSLEEAVVNAFKERLNQESLPSASGGDWKKEAIELLQRVDQLIRDVHPSDRSILNAIMLLRDRPARFDEPKESPPRSASTKVELIKEVTTLLNDYVEDIYWRSRGIPDYRVDDASKAVVSLLVEHLGVTLTTERGIE